MSAIIENEGIRVQNAPTCYLCSGRGQVLYSGLRDRLFTAPGRWRLLRCSHCDLVWLDPRPIREDLHKLYTTYFTHGARFLQGERLPGIRNTIKASVLAAGFGYESDVAQKFLGAWFAPIGLLRDIAGSKVMWLDASQRGRLLDVGCGDGQFLWRMSRLGWEVVGVEPDREAGRVARQQYGLVVHDGSLEEAELPEDSFDAVTLNHVVEHLPDPIATLRACRRVLKPGGVLVVATPNLAALGRRLFGHAWRGWEPPRHLFLFSTRILRQTMERAGLRVLKSWTTARSAREMWIASRSVLRTGRLPHGSLNHASLHLQIQGLLFQVIESVLCAAQQVGEEIVVLATKGDGTLAPQHGGMERHALPG